MRAILTHRQTHCLSPPIARIFAHVFLQLRGQPTGATFRSDGVNFNSWGYTQMSLLLRQRMETDLPQFF